MDSLLAKVGPGGQLREVVLYHSVKHRFKFLVCHRARGIILHDSLAYCAFSHNV